MLQHCRKAANVTTTLPSMQYMPCCQPFLVHSLNQMQFLLTFNNASTELMRQAAGGTDACTSTYCNICNMKAMEAQSNKLVPGLESDDSKPCRTVLTILVRCLALRVWDVSMTKSSLHGNTHEVELRTRHQACNMQWHMTPGRQWHMKPHCVAEELDDPQSLAAVLQLRNTSHSGQAMRCHAP